MAAKKARDADWRQKIRDQAETKNKGALDSATKQLEGIPASAMMNWTVYTSVRTHQLMKAVAAQRGVSVQELLRAVLDEFLEKVRKSA